MLLAYYKRYVILLIVSALFFLCLVHPTGNLFMLSSGKVIAVSAQSTANSPSNTSATLPICLTNSASAAIVPPLTAVVPTTELHENYFPTTQEVQQIMGINESLRNGMSSNLESMGMVNLQRNGVNESNWANAETSEYANTGNNWSFNSAVPSTMMPLRGADLTYNSPGSTIASTSSNSSLEQALALGASNNSLTAAGVLRNMVDERT